MFAGLKKPEYRNNIVAYYMLVRKKQYSYLGTYHYVNIADFFRYFSHSSSYERRQWVEPISPSLTGNYETEPATE